MNFTSSCYRLTDAVAGEIRAEAARQLTPHGDLARSVPMSYSTFRRRMAGESSFTLRELSAICERLDITVSELMNRARAQLEASA